MIPLSWVLLAASAAAAQTAVPAFPGAEGFGSHTVGGRGGRVVLVTNLHDSGPGSLREACDAKGPRIIVFRIGGTIELKAPLRIREPFVTIAGQTAPGDGICLRGSQVTVDAHDVVIRHLRVRPGDISGQAVDGIGVGGSSRNVVIDHCSVSWSVDELLSASGAISDVTIQWSLIAEALNKSVHSKGEHGYGSLVRAIGGVSLHHNLWAHNNARNPRLGDNYGKPPFPTFDVRNNVMYDFGGMCSGMTGDRLSANYVGNYILPGPSSNRKRGVIVFTETAAARYFLDGNFVEHGVRLIDREEIAGRRVVTVVDNAFESAPVATTTADDAFNAVLEGVGATAPKRDAVDSRIIEQVRKRSGRIIDSQNDVGGWPEYRTGDAPVDSDRDGMPDEWERKHRLNPEDPADAALDRDADGYTNIEEYINSLVRGK